MPPLPRAPGLRIEALRFFPLPFLPFLYPFDLYYLVSPLLLDLAARQTRLGASYLQQPEHPGQAEGKVEDVTKVQTLLLSATLSDWGARLFSTKAIRC
ncbi:unnamed protein product [Urochloa humidicola]